MMLRILLAFVASLHFAVALPQNKVHMFRKDASPKIIPGETVVVEDAPPAKAPEAGEMLVKIKVMGAIPSYAARLDTSTWVRDQGDDYPAFALNEPVFGEVVFEVLDSKAGAFARGDHVVGFYPLTLYQTIKADGSDTMMRMPPTKCDANVPPEKYLSLISVTAGLTAYYSVNYLDGAVVEQGCGGGKTVIVTAASSATGQVAGQLYKLKGCKVIGSTSTKAKAAETMQLGGFDAVIAYKEEDFESRLKELAPNGIDYDFENVGGPMMDIIIRHMNMHGTVVMCGAIHDYNSENPHGLKALMSVVLKRLRIQGLMVYDLMPHMAEALPALSQLVADGKVKSSETKVQGFERWAEALNLMLSSKSLGRTVVEVPSHKDEL